MCKEIVSKNGYYKTQISDIIKDAKIARGTVYQYFENKEDIFITLLDSFYMKWENSISIYQSELDLKSISAREYLCFRITKTLRFFAADADLCQIILRMGLGLSGTMSDAVMRFEERIINLIVSDLTFGKANGNIRPGVDIVLAANLIAGSILHAAYHYFGARAVHPESVNLDDIAEAITGILSPGILLPSKR